MTRLFVSYRRADERHFVDRLVNALSETYGEKNVFRDIESLTAGKRFADEIDARISTVDVVIVMIGPQWETLGQRPAEDDFVAREVARAQAHGKVIIPVLIDARAVPTTTGLAPALAELNQLHTLAVRGGRDFDHDYDLLVHQIDAHTGSRATPVIRSVVRGQRRGVMVASLTLAAAMVAVFALASRDSGTSRLAIDDTISTESASNPEDGTTPATEALTTDVPEVTDGETTTSVTDPSTTDGGGSNGNGGWTPPQVTEPPITTTTAPPTTTTKPPTTTTTTTTIPRPGTFDGQPLAADYVANSTAGLSCHAPSSSFSDLFCPVVHNNNLSYAEQGTSQVVWEASVPLTDIGRYCTAASNQWNCSLAYSFAALPTCGVTEVDPVDFPSQLEALYTLRLVINGRATPGRVFTVTTWRSDSTHWRMPTQRSKVSWPDHFAVTDFSISTFTKPINLKVEIVVPAFSSYSCTTGTFHLRMPQSTVGTATVYRGFVGTYNGTAPFKIG